MFEETLQMWKTSVKSVVLSASMWLDNLGNKD